MRLSWISESFISAKMREALTAPNYSELSGVAIANPPYEPTSGHSNLPEKGAMIQPTGVPNKPRVRKYLGMETRPGTIRL